MHWIIIIFIVIVIVFSLISLAVQYWYVSIPLVIICIIIYKTIDSYQQKKLAEEAERKRLADEASRLDSECRSLAVLRETSHSKFYSLDQLVSSANGCLDTAQREFEERAFAPFWDALENATNFLGAYHQSIGEIKKTATDYETRRSRLSVSVPVFDVPEAGVPDARPLASRLSSLGRAAQKDFQFATIYEQRKTNQLLYSGFGTLAAGLERMQYAITDALDDLSLSLGTRLDDLLTVSTSHAEAFNNYSQAAASHYKTSEDESKKQSEMLDNIQRGHKPPEGTLDRIFHTRVEGDTTKPHDVSADD